MYKSVKIKNLKIYLKKIIYPIGNPVLSEWRELNLEVEPSWG